MREHMGLYRGKRLDNGEWVQGNLWYDPDVVRAAITWFEYYNGDNGLERDWNTCTVDPDTVGECTGLTDKNGKLIFEGDVLRITDRFLKALNWTVEYRNYGFFVKHPLCDYWWHISELNGYTVEIIGNIHDNPELLKGGEG